MSASLRRRRDAHTVLVRMARDEARAGRVRELKGRFPEGDPSWAEIAAYVGVAERSALAWQQTGEISRSNAIKLARFFIERGVRIGEDYIWDGPKPDTPDLLTVLNGDESKLDEALAQLKQLLERQESLVDAVTALTQEIAELRQQQRPGRRRAS
jgi:hypothetical protein